MGHQGIECTIGLLRKRCFWVSMYIDEDQWIKRCQRCVLTKMPQPRIHAPMKPFLASRPLEVVAVDFTVLEPSSDGRENVLIVKDVFTKFTQTFPTRDQRADSTGKFILKYTKMRDTEPKQFMPDTSAALRVEEPVLKKPVPTPRRTKRANAGEHSNPFNKPEVCMRCSLTQSFHKC